MKKTILILSVMLLIASSCGYVTKKRQVEAIETIKEFYTLLVTETDKSQPDMQTIDNIMNQYVTTNFKEKLRQSDLNYEYFMYRGYISMECLETLEITPDNRWDDAYKVCWRCTDRTKVCITLLLVKNKKYMIDNIDGVEIYEYEGNDEYDDDSEFEYLQKNYVKLDAALLAQTSIQGMAAEYDSLRHAIAFASEILNLPSFPLQSDDSESLFFRLNFDDYDRDNAIYAKWGTGMKPFHQLLNYANSSRKHDMAGLDKLLLRYGTLIKHLIPYEKYVANGWEQITNQLLVAYNDLSVSPGSFGKVYEIMRESDGNLNYEKIAPFVRDSQMKAFIASKDIGYTHKNEFIPFLKRGEINRWSVIWAYSFWGRRYNENPDNIPHLVATLKAIRKLYTPDSTLSETNKNNPPIEPYLTSEIRPNEQIYPWKLYTDRVKFLEHVWSYEENSCIIIEHNGKQHQLLSRLNEDNVLNRGDIIDLTWNMGIMYYYDKKDNKKIKFSEWADRVKMVEATATTLFEKKYGSFPKICYGDIAVIDDATQAKLLDRLMISLLTDKNKKITKVQELLRKPEKEKLEIVIYDCEEYKIKPQGTLFGHVVEIVLRTESPEPDKPIILFIYNPVADTLHIDVYGVSGNGFEWK